MLEKPNHNLAPGHVTRCQVCGSSNLDLVIDLGHQPLCDSLLTPEQLNEPEMTYPLRLVTCRDCSLAQIDHVVDGETVFHKSYPYRSGITRELADHHRRLSMDVIKRIDLKPDSLVVDIGSNDGTLLSGFKAQGMRVVGVEPTDIAKIAIAQGVDTLQDFFNEDTAKQIAETHGKASVVTATNVFAHMADLGSVIRAVEQLLTDDGMFVIETHYLLDILRDVQYDSIYHEHIRYYSIKSLMKLFSYYDLTMVDAHRVASYGGSMRVFVAKGRDKPRSQSLANLIAEEAAFGLYEPHVYTTFRENALEARRDLMELVYAANRKGERLVANSCPGRAATLLNFCGLDPHLVPYIAEQPTSLKLNKYAPGCQIPVVENSILFKEQPDYVLLLAWHYGEPISKNLRERGLKSKLIMPLPKMRVLD